MTKSEIIGVIVTILLLVAIASGAYVYTHPPVIKVTHKIEIEKSELVEKSGKATGKFLKGLYNSIKEKDDK